MTLLIDTSGPTLIVALGDLSGRILTSREATAKPNERGIHDARLALEVATVLGEAGVQPKEVSRIGVVVGPGSFTGLRIGVSFAKGFAGVWGAGIIPIITHELLADPTLPAETLLLADGYQPALVYVARNGAPKETWLAKRAEIDEKTAIGTADQHQRLGRMLRVATVAEPTGTAELEPHYVTDFSVGLPGGTLEVRQSEVKNLEPKPAEKV